MEKFDWIRPREVINGMRDLSLDYTKTLDFFKERELTKCLERLKSVHEMLHNGTGAGSEYLGWLDLPLSYDRNEFKNILATAQEIRNNSDVLVVIGIGGSYLGARAAIEALGHSFYNLLGSDRRKAPQVFFAGNNVSPAYLADLGEILRDREVTVNVISKSGTTTEPAIAFRYFKEYMERRYGKSAARNRIYVTTDRTEGMLRKLANEEGYKSFVIPCNTGGRYSVLTAVGLLPIAAAGIDIEEMMNGAAYACEKYRDSEPSQNDCYLYAAVRNVLYDRGREIEILVNYEPCLHYFGEWWKQLYGESEGKEGKGIFPASVDFTTDLHSLGQYIQEGRRTIFETVLNVEKPKRDIIIEKCPDDIDGLAFLEGKSMDYINKKAMEGTIQAHVDGGVPNIVLNIPQMSAYYFGQMVYFFEKACGASGYLLGVNPFDQPGVEAYKRNMFRLLGKPGYQSDI